MLNNSKIDFLDYYISAAICAFMLITAFLINNTIFHWATVLASFCGFLAGLEIVSWARHKVEMFDCNFLIGLVVFVGFFISPILLMISGDSTFVEGVKLDELKYWVGLTSAFYLSGYLVFLIGYRVAIKTTKVKRSVWIISKNKFLIFTCLVLILQILFQLKYMAAMGGISGWLKYRTTGGQSASLTGLGPFLVIGRSLPIVFALLVTYLKTGLKGETNQSFVSTYIFLILCVILQFAVSGLSGSRNSIIFSCIWFLFLSHNYWKPFNRSTLVLVFVVFISFMYVYGFYKALGANVFHIYKHKKKISSIKKYAPNRTFRNLVVGDLSRIDINAAQVFILSKRPWKYRLRYGTTYLDSIVPLIPRKLWPNKPTDSGKVIAGTEMLYGPDSYAERAKIWRTTRGHRSTRIYGLFGEWLLNFGLLGFPIPFFIYGYSIGRFKRFVVSLHQEDARNFVVPGGIILAFTLLINDFSNHVAFLLYTCTVPIILILLTTKKRVSIS